MKGNAVLLSKIGLFLAAVIWGSTFVVIQDAAAALSPNFIIAFRYTVGFLLLTVVFHKKLRELDRGYLACGAVVAVTVFTSMYCQTQGLAVGVTPGKSGFLTAVYIAVVPLFHWMLNHLRPTRWSIGAAVLCMIGIGCISLDGNLTIGWGELLTIVGGVMCALNLALTAKLVRTKDPVLLALVQFGFVALYAWVSVLAGGGLPVEPVSWKNWAGVAYLGIFATGLCILCQNVSMKYVDPGYAALVMSLESVFSVLLSIMLGREVLSGRLVLGFVLVFLSILTSETHFSFLRRFAPRAKSAS